MFHWWNFLCLLNAGSICRFSALRQVQTASQQIDAALQEAQTTKLPKILQQVEEQRVRDARQPPAGRKFLSSTSGGDQLPSSLAVNFTSDLSLDAGIRPTFFNSTWARSSPRLVVETP